MNMEETVRVRYAPSPTGEPHVGNIRTALFNWLYARHVGGKFILRIEDTDVTREVKGAVGAILDSLRWLGLDWDEGPEVGGPYGPYFQSQRLELYQAFAQQLVDEGYAYPCYCSPQRLEEMRAEQRRRREPPRYDRRCRNLSLKEREALAAGVEKPVIRFKTPLEGDTIFHDLVHGDVTFTNAALDDFILLKSDGYPTYHLANVVDDHFMKISHVLRADEWLASTPRHCLLYQALSWDPPQFVHLPMILGSDRAKLSKRHGATATTEYKKQGYLPQAMVNFLALLGWSLDDKTELLDRKELVRHFSLERIGKTAAIFNLEKLRWLNGVYLRGLSIEELVKRTLPFLEAGLPSIVARPLSKGYVSQIMPLIQERMRTLAEAVELADFFFIDELDYDASLLKVKNISTDVSGQALIASRDRIAALSTFAAGALEGVLRPLAGEMGLKTGQLFGLLRVAVTGRTAAPPLFETMAVLGRERCLKRLEVALTKMENLS